MKRKPTRKKYYGRSFAVPTTLPDLLRHPVGACCFYFTKDPYDFEACAHSMAKRAGGAIYIQLLIAIKLKTYEIIEIARVVVTKQARKPAQFKASTVNFCAPPGMLARCKKGTRALYEHNDYRNIGKVFAQVGGRGQQTTLYAIDIESGTNYPLAMLEVIKPARRYQLPPKSITIYQAFIA